MNPRISNLLNKLMNETLDGDPGFGAAPEMGGDSQAVDDFLGTFDTPTTSEPEAPAPAPAPEPEPSVQLEPAPAAAPVTPAEPAAAPTTPPEAPAVPPAPVPAEPQAPAATDPTPPPPAAPDFDPAEFEQRFTENLVQSYQLTEQERAAWDEDPVAALPQLAANLHKRILTEALATVQAALPAQIERYQQSTSREQEAKNMFFTAWPALRPYEKQVIQAGQMYAKMAPPNATPEMRIQAIGRMVAAAVGMDLQPAAPAPVAPPATTSQPIQPYVPSGGGSGVGAAPAPSNIFGEMIDIQD